MINQFCDFYAEITDKKRIAFTLDDSYGDDEYRYCPMVKLDIFGIPADVEESEAEQILDGEKSGGVHIATLIGNIISVGAIWQQSQKEATATVSRYLADMM